MAVFLKGGRAENRGAYWLGGPDFCVEVVSPDDLSREKLAFYSKVGVGELMMVDRDPWRLELYRGDTSLQCVGTSSPENQEELRSEVIHFVFRMTAADPRPQIEVTHPATGRQWTI